MYADASMRVIPQVRTKWGQNPELAPGRTCPKVGQDWGCLCPPQNRPELPIMGTGCHSTRCRVLYIGLDMILYNDHQSFYLVPSTAEPIVSVGWGFPHPTPLHPTQSTKGHVPQLCVRILLLSVCVPLLCFLCPPALCLCPTSTFLHLLRIMFLYHS